MARQFIRLQQIRGLAGGQNSDLAALGVLADRGARICELQLSSPLQ